MMSYSKVVELRQGKAAWMHGDMGYTGIREPEEHKDRDVKSHQKPPFMKNNPVLFRASLG